MIRKVRQKYIEKVYSGKRKSILDNSTKEFLIGEDGKVNGMVEYVNLPEMSERQINPRNFNDFYKEFEGEYTHILQIAFAENSDLMALKDLVTRKNPDNKICWYHGKERIIVNGDITLENLIPKICSIHYKE